ncbi:hypothetical protein [Pyxidicoccus caerfyrddinensis]|uniref:hypothetical protein n=1 Tax=Pyxidicoccus caerfyrddinensis TaxID=2709663 RepID=UPI0013DC4ADA|nr:hypothetical protein [Pyxidicoccus caerfyrddinensis]
MDYRKLFQVLVMGGALVGGATGCNQGNKSNEDRSGSTEGTGGSGSADAGTHDAGTAKAGGGGVKGW